MALLVRHQRERHVHDHERVPVECASDRRDDADVPIRELHVLRRERRELQRLQSRVAERVQEHRRVPDERSVPRRAWLHLRLAVRVAKLCVESDHERVLALWCKRWACKADLRSDLHARAVHHRLLDLSRLEARAACGRCGRLGACTIVIRTLVHQRLTLMTLQCMSITEQAQRREQRRQERAAQRGLKSDTQLSLTGWKAMQEELLQLERAQKEGSSRTLRGAARLSADRCMQSDRDASRASAGAEAVVVEVDRDDYDGAGDADCSDREEGARCSPRSSYSEEPRRA